MELIIVQHSMLLTTYSAFIALLEWTSRSVPWLKGDWGKPARWRSWRDANLDGNTNPLSTVDAKQQTLNSKQWLSKQIVYLVSDWLPQLVKLRENYIVSNLLILLCVCVCVPSTCVHLHVWARGGIPVALFRDSVSPWTCVTNLARPAVYFAS